MPRWVLNSHFFPSTVELWNGLDGASRELPPAQFMKFIVIFLTISNRACVLCVFIFLCCLYAIFPPLNTQFWMQCFVILLDVTFPTQLLIHAVLCYVCYQYCVMLVLLRSTVPTPAISHRGMAVCVNKYRYHNGRPSVKAVLQFCSRKHGCPNCEGACLVELLDKRPCLLGIKKI